LDLDKELEGLACPEGSPFAQAVVDSVRSFDLGQQASVETRIDGKPGSVRLIS
jgi:hypothetical protein